jgi:hypothetical protein
MVPRTHASSSIFLNATKPTTSVQPDSKIAVTYSRGARSIAGVARAVINPVFVGFLYTSILEWFTVFTALGYVASFSYNTLRTAASS